MRSEPTGGGTGGEGLSWFQQSADVEMRAPWSWLATWEALIGLIVCAAMVLLFAALRARRRRTQRCDLSRLGETQALKEQLRIRLSEPFTLFSDPARAGPIMGASEGFEGDIEAAAHTVLIEAGGQRAKAKELLRKRLGGDAGCSANDGASLNGSGVASWRQLGALSLLDNASDAITAYAKAADLAPDDAQVQMLAGILHLRAGNLAAAEAAFRRQIKLASIEDGQVWRYRGRTMLG